jgi:hypothetical protein
LFACLFSIPPCPVQFHIHDERTAPAPRALDVLRRALLVFIVEPLGREPGPPLRRVERNRDEAAQVETVSKCEDGSALFSSKR